MQAAKVTCGGGRAAGGRIHWGAVGAEGSLHDANVCCRAGQLRAAKVRVVLRAEVGEQRKQPHGIAGGDGGARLQSCKGTSLLSCDARLVRLMMLQTRVAPRRKLHSRTPVAQACVQKHRSAADATSGLRCSLLPLCYMMLLHVATCCYMMLHY